MKTEMINVYPVGLLADIKHRQVLRSLPYAWRRIRSGDWRAVKNWLNGYLAEPYEFPPGVHRCGTGWTRLRALRSWDRQCRKADRRG